MELSISVIITVWRRFKYLPEIISGWCAQADELIIWDNSGNFKTHGIADNVLVINSSRNLGDPAKFQAVTLAKNDWVIIADDDVLPKPGLVSELRDAIQKLSHYLWEDRIFGYFGRMLLPHSYRESPTIQGTDIKTVTEVPWIGQLYFGHRSNFIFDSPYWISSILSDLYWIQYLREKKGERPQICILPSQIYKQTDECRDKNSIYCEEGFYIGRDNFVRTHYNDLVPKRLRS